MVPFFSGAILLLGIEHVLFPAIKLLSRDHIKRFDWLTLGQRS